MKKYNSAASISFVVLHDEEEPTIKDLTKALEERLEYFRSNPLEFCLNVEVYDTIEND